MLPGETISSGGSNVCSDCGIHVKLDVYHSGGGYYIGSYCNCGPYSRESGYYNTYDQAYADFQSDTWEERF
jgi:hypothetical protein